MKCGECNQEAFFSITDQNKNKRNKNLAVYYFCGDCYANYQEKNAK